MINCHIVYTAYEHSRLPHTALRLYVRMLFHPFWG
nr:MAG TPA: hypothetical protein [Crassvirales sp.]